jgi:hypothetical protein
MLACAMRSAWATLAGGWSPLMHILGHLPGVSLPVTARRLVLPRLLLA